MATETDTQIRHSQIDRARHPWERFRFGGGCSVREGSTGHEALLVFVLRNPVYVSWSDMATCRIEPQNLFFIPPDTTYRIEGRGTAKVVTCLFGFAFFECYGYDTSRFARRRGRRKKVIHCMAMTEDISKMEGLAEIYIGMDDHLPDQLECCRRMVFDEIVEALPAQELALLIPPQLLNPNEKKNYGSNMS